MEFFGALKCLMNWYNAALTMVDMLEEKNSASEEWVSLLGGKLVSLAEFQDMEEIFPQWRGTVTLTSSQVKYSPNN